MKRFTRLFLFISVFSGCTYDFPEQPDSYENLSTGEADLNVLFTIGGMWSSGLLDGSVSTTGQGVSYSNLIVQQINKAKGFNISYEQPMMSLANGLNYFEDASDFIGPYQLDYSIEGSDILFKHTQQGVQFGEYEGIAQNVSFPGLKAIDFRIPLTNEYFDRFSSTEVNTLEKHVSRLSPSIVFMELGMADIFNYASHGLTGEENPMIIEENDLTPILDFEDSLRAVLNHPVIQGADVLLSTIPDFIDFPFFQQLSHLALITAGETGTVNSFYESNFNPLARQLNVEQGQTIRATINYFDDGSPTTWRVVVEDPSLPDATLMDGTVVPKYRVLVDGENVLWSVRELPADPSTPKEGLQIPLHKTHFITSSEKSQIEQLIEDYNEIIRGLASEFGNVYLVDVFEHFQLNSSGNIQYDGVNYDLSLSRSGIISADGISLNQRGQALLANAFIQVLNNDFDASIPEIDPNSFSGNSYLFNEIE